MRISRRFRNRFLTWLAVIAFGAVAGYAYAQLAYKAEIANIPTGGLRAAITGSMIAGSTTGFEIFMMLGRFGNWLKRLPFVLGTLLRIGIHTVLVVTCLIVTRIAWAMNDGKSPVDEFIASNWLQDLLYSFVIIAGVLFVMQMRLLVGGRTLLNVVLGKYRRPIREERLFLLVDLLGSTALAAKLGDERFHSYVSNFFFDVDQPIVEAGGEIYSYVGDAVFAAWPLRDHQQNAKAVRAIVSMRMLIDERAPLYEERFGVAPRFRAVLHGGPVVAGECGSSRRQITYLGDVLNTTARLEALAKDLRVENLISDEILKRIALPDGVTVRDLEQHRLKGVAEPIRAWSLELRTSSMDEFAAPGEHASQVAAQ